MKKAAAVLALLVAAVPVSAGARPAVDLAGIDKALAGIYGSYQHGDFDGADWEKPVFSSETARLIAAWHQTVGGELTDLGDHGWFCDCQDWDGKLFRWRRQSVRPLEPGRVEVRVRINMGWGSKSEQRLVLINEQGRWLVDDVFSPGARDGIKAGLAQELTRQAED